MDADKLMERLDQAELSLEYAVGAFFVGKDEAVEEIAKKRAVLEEVKDEIRYCLRHGVD